MSDVIRWINERIINDQNNEIGDDDVDVIRDFTLLWNLFEALCFGNNVNMREIYSLIDSKIDLFEETGYQNTFDYFYNRYKNDVPKLNALNLRNSEELVTKVLDDEYQDKKNKLKFVMAIIYRYRNNLFHGEKNVRYLGLQKENFEKTNELLMYFIETCRDN